MSENSWILRVIVKGRTGTALATSRKPFMTGWAAALPVAALAFGLASPALAAAQISRACASAPDLVLTNAKILTVDKNDSVASTLRIRGDRILTVGKDVGAVDACTRTIDLGGRTVIPGFIDAHVHYLRGGMRPGHELTAINTSFSIAALQAAIKKRAATLPAAKGPTKSDDFIVAIDGWNPLQFAEKRLPSLKELDQAAPDRPVFLMIYPLGPSATNSKGKAFLAKRRIQVAENGLIAGRRGRPPTDSQRAYFVLSKGQTLDQKKRSLREHMEYSASIGLLTVVDGGGGLPGAGKFNEYKDYEAVLALWREGSLGVRIRAQYQSTARNTDGLAAIQARVDNTSMGLGDDMFKVAGFAENIVAETTPIQPVELFEKAFTIAAKKGWTVQQHSIDMEELIQHTTAFERVNAKIPIADLHWSLAHVNDIDDGVLRRLKAMKAGVSVTMHWYSGFFPVGKVGPPYRKVLDSGINVGASSDGGWIPWTWIYHMTTGKTAGGKPILAKQKITRMEALRISTIGSAWIVREENELGSIEPGKLADLVVLSEDYLTVPDEKLRSVKSVLSILGGDIVYSDGRVVKCRAGQSGPWHRQGRKDRCVIQ